MSVYGTSVVDELSPQETYDFLTEHESAALIDVRTTAEWSFVGIPDVQAIGTPLWLVEWVSFPTMAPNAGFVNQIAAKAEGSLPDRLFFICRSGVRSMMAAQSVAHAMQEKGHALHCTNVTEGFEGDLDDKGHRGKKNGWKACGLPWRQS